MTAGVDAMLPARQVETDPTLEGVYRYLARHAIARAALDPATLGGVLAACRRRRGFDDVGLAAFLGCPLAHLPRLAWFVRPDPLAAHFTNRVSHIAALTGADAGRLATVILSEQC